MITAATMDIRMSLGDVFRMRNFLFDISSIPIYVLILWTCYVRKITKDHASRVFIMMNVTSLICAVLDIAMELVVAPVPISQGAVVAGNLISYSYLALRNATLVLYLVFIFSVTRTEFRIRSPWMRLLLWAPDTVLLILLLQNPFTHNVFNVTTEAGYTRGPLMIGLYTIAAFYGLSAAGYGFAVRKYLTAGKWVAMISVFVLTFIAVFVQLINPHYLIEMFSTAIGLLMIMLLVMRPEENVDAMRQSVINIHTGRKESLGKAVAAAWKSTRGLSTSPTMFQPYINLCP